MLASDQGGPRGDDFSASTVKEHDGPTSVGGVGKIRCSWPPSRTESGLPPRGASGRAFFMARSPAPQKARKFASGPSRMDLAKLFGPSRIARWAPPH